MRKSFNPRSPQGIVRVVLGVLVVANLVAAGFVLFPPGGSAEDLEQQRITLDAQLRAARARVDLTRLHASAVEKGRKEGDDFLNKYFLTSRTAFSTLLSQLDAASKPTKLKPRDNAYALEPVEGSDTLSMMSITAAYEGTYQDLLHFVNEIDKSNGLLIIESLSAAPQANSDTLSVSMKLNTFVRGAEETGGQ
jgi:type IV pilus assembly protein PilO